jgi:transcription elongation GreA/GreB family factor
MENIKKELYQLCLGYIEERMAAAQKAIEDAEDAMKNDTKSSAGDKYETGREMAQQEISRNKLQLTEAARQKQLLERINPTKASRTVQPGSLVYTDHGSFYLAISAGQFTLNAESFFAVSPGSPIGVKLSGLQDNDEIHFNGRDYKILKVC